MPDRHLTRLFLRRYSENDVISPDADRLQFVVLDRQRVVEEHHHAVSGEVLERRVVRPDELSEHAVVLAQDLEQLFGRSRLGERGEPTQVAEETGDVRAVPREQSLAVLARDQLGDGRRDEA